MTISLGGQRIYLEFLGLFLRMEDAHYIGISCYNRISYAQAAHWCASRSRQLRTGSVAGLGLSFQDEVANERVAS